MMAPFLCYLDPLSPPLIINKKKTLSELNPLWQNFLDPRMNVSKLGGGLGGGG